MQRNLLPPMEYWLHEGAVFALWAGTVGRLAYGFLRNGKLWLYDTQMAGLCLLLILLFLSSCYVPRRYAELAAVLLGGISWLGAIGIAFGIGWPRVVLPLWLLVLLAVAMLAAWLVRVVLAVQWRKHLYGLGFRAIIEWAEEQPLFARLSGIRLLKQRGYYRR
jgi:hypothetical protein